MGDRVKGLNIIHYRYVYNIKEIELRQIERIEEADMRIVAGTTGMPVEPSLHKVMNQIGGILHVVVV